ncbi:YhcH/YjgK/YiaL family protein [Paenibacillus sp. UNC499MF]|uniref:YhcH/YjgK/YiaL family protein n=1 Tax=Paenibacillus sp. UNC499MF TaxID=1502751 RepID=UPI0015E23024|nr:YhcH/YjgK/YiaL family protein [Paenibacillus sp. UNC499MF]
MILGSLNNWKQDRKFAHPALADVLDRLEKIPFRELENGKHPVRGEDIFFTIMELEAKDPAEAKAEKHERYIDVHFLLEGAETVGWSVDNGKSAVTEHSPEGDYTLFEPAAEEERLRLTPGMYAVFFPEDIHRPGLRSEGGEAASPIRKAVFKISTALFEKA